MRHKTDGKNFSELTELAALQPKESRAHSRALQTKNLVAEFFKKWDIKQTGRTFQNWQLLNLENQELIP